MASNLDHSNTELSTLGADKQSIAHHYDIGNDFYQLWLDKTMTYTAALWLKSTDDLYSAQINKINYVLDSLHLAKNQRLLDIGCGWGGLLNYALGTYQLRQAVGLTLSEAQANWVSMQHPGIDCELINWHDYSCAEPFDGITSVESIEAFVKPGINNEKKIAVYKRFFEQCSNLLKSGGRLYLQAICYGKKNPEDLDDFIKSEIFPDSDLPLIEELFSASKKHFEIISVKNDRQDYIKTLKQWQSNLRSSKNSIVNLYNIEMYDRYKSYLKLSEFMFAEANCLLLRMIFSKLK